MLRVDYLSQALSAREVDKLIPQLANDAEAVAQLRSAATAIETCHSLWAGDSRDLKCISDGSVNLIVTSPPYWNLKFYNGDGAQLGNIVQYEEFVQALGDVWKECFRVLAPGGRLCVVVGDVVVSRKQHGRHKCYPLHSSIALNCEEIGFDSLSPIFWRKIANAKFEATGNSGQFLGKPYEPGGIIKNNVEYVLLFRKPGPYRSVDPQRRLMSILQRSEHRDWFQQVWQDIPGQPKNGHPAPYPIALAERLIRMFSFAGDVVLDPFMGSGTTNLAACVTGRNSLGVDIDSEYADQAELRLKTEVERLGLSRAIVRRPGFL